jgi:hypothetical protein
MREHWRIAVASLVLAATTTAQIGPFTQEALLTDPTPSVPNLFGRSVAVSDDTVVIGAAEDAVGGVVNAGAAYVFIRSGGTWSWQATLTAADPATYDFFGHSVAVSGDTLLVGAFGDDKPGQEESGSVYVFVRDGGTWTQQAKITNPVSIDDDLYGGQFGWAVAVEGDTAVIGAPEDDVVPEGPGAQASRGSAYVFVREGAGWGQQAKLTASDAVDDDDFGGAVAVSGDTVVVGRREFTAFNRHAREAYVFARMGSLWAAETELADPGLSGSAFAGSVGVSGDTVVCGDYEAAPVKVFVRTAGQWLLQATLLPMNMPIGSGGPLRVAVEGDIVLLGIQSPPPLWGEGYLFKRAGSSWSQLGTLTPPDASSGIDFGASVAIDGSTVVVGAGANSSGATNGRAYVFQLVPIGSWVNLGLGLSGTSGIPVLTGAGYLQATSPIALSLAQAKPFALAPLVVGIANLSAPFKGGTMVPTPDLVFPLFTDFFGAGGFGGAWPAGVPSGLQLFFQWWVQDPAGPKGFAASNAVQAAAP